MALRILAQLHFGEAERRAARIAVFFRHLVGDGYLIRGTVSVRFEVIWRTAAGTETVLATATHTFMERPAGPDQGDAVAYETDLDGIAAAAGGPLATTLSADATVKPWPVPPGAPAPTIDPFLRRGPA